MHEKVTFIDNTEGHLGVSYFKRFNKLFNYRVQKDLLSWCVYSITLNDKAHDLKHVYSVCNTAVGLLQHYNEIYDISERDELLILHACLLHDIGCRYNRKYHHVIGYGLTFEYVNRYCPGEFSEEELLIIAKCVLEHRSSAGKKPTGILSQIVHVADKGCPDIQEYVRRAILFRLDSISDIDEMVDLVYQHIQEKFCKEQGYHWNSYPSIGLDYFSDEWQEFDRYVKDKDALVNLIRTTFTKLKTPT